MAKRWMRGHNCLFSSGFNKQGSCGRVIEVGDRVGVKAKKKPHNRWPKMRPALGRMNASIARQLDEKLSASANAASMVQSKIKEMDLEQSLSNDVSYGPSPLSLQYNALREKENEIVTNKSEGNEKKVGLIWCPNGA
ncbi:Uncharacterized protein Fot_22236 [Forsythia ovata]|uniref:Uncharacterized protein n=1 Tax=Forsythia ovata TaxID=205694 RepID=A0ABD1UX51_9LAMI